MVKLKRNAQAKLTRPRTHKKKAKPPLACLKCGFRHPRKAPWCGFASLKLYLDFRRGEKRGELLVKNAFET